MDWKELRKMDRDDVLKLLGLQTQSDASEWVLPAMGLLAAGVLVGVGLGLFLAPKAGREIRQDLRQRFLGAAAKADLGATVTAAAERVAAHPTM